MCLSPLPITYHRPKIHDTSKACEGTGLWQEIQEAATTDKHRAHTVDEPPAWVDKGQLLGPVGHGGHGGEQSWQQNETDDDEPQHEQRLLQGVVVVGYDKSQPADGEDE